MSTFRNNVRWQIVGSVTQAALGCLILFMVGRGLGAQQFGLFSVVNGMVAVGLALTEVRLQDVAARQFSHALSGMENAPYFADFLFLDLATKLPVCLFLAISGEWLARIIPMAQGAGGLIAVAAIGAIVARSGSNLAMGTLRAYGRSDLLVLSALIELMLRGGATAALFATGHLTVWNCIVVQAITGAICNIQQTLMCRRFVQGLGAALGAWRPKHLTRLRSNKRLLTANLAISVSDLMVKDLDVVLLSTLTSPGGVGVYKMAKNVVTLIWRGVDPFTLSLMPEVSRLVGANDIAALRRLRRLSAAWLFAMTAIGSVVVWSALHLFGVRILGHSYADVSAILPVMLFGVVMCAPLVWSHPLSVALDRPELAFVGSFVGLLAGAAALFILTPMIGLQGAAIAWMLSFAGHFIYCGWASDRALRAMRPRESGG